MQPDRHPASHKGRAHSSRPRGLTLIELMVVLAIVAILATVALPAFLGLIRSNRVASEVNAFVGDLQFARAQAIAHGLTTTVCASTDGVACSQASNWETGWIVFSDPSGTATTSSSTSTLLRVQPAWVAGGSSDTMSASGNTSAIHYSRDGFALGLAGTITLTLHTSPVNASATRCVALTLAGRQTVQSAGTGNCT